VIIIVLESDDLLACKFRVFFYKDMKLLFNIWCAAT